MLKRLIAASAALALLATITGCEAQADSVGGKERPFIARRVVSLSPSTTELVSLGARYPGLVGKTTACNFPMVLQNVKNVVNGTDPNYELIKEAEPDLIMYDAALYTEADVAKFEEFGAKLFPYDPKTLEDYEKTLIEIAQITGQETRASEYLDKINAAVETGKGSIPADTVSMAILIRGGGTEYMASGEASFLANLFKRMNLVVKAPSGERFMPINVESLVDWNPDMIIGTPETADAVLKDPRLSGLAAVKNKQVFGVNPDVLLRAGSRVDTLLFAIEQPAQRIAVSKGNQ